MKNTGERMLPEKKDQYYYEHIHRYALAAEYSRDKTVLDIASGEGYGSDFLAENAKFVYGIDICDEAINQAKLKYKKKNLTYIQGSTSRIPIEDHSVDLVVSFETIEHHDEHIQMMLEIKRVLKCDGVLLISSPDKEFYTDKGGNSNPFHVKELYYTDFKELISGYFKHYEILYQKMQLVSLIIPEKSINGFIEFSGDLEFIKRNSLIQNAPYNLAIASDVPIPIIVPNIYSANLNIYKLMTSPDLVEMYKNSTSYKLGFYLLHPLELLKKKRNQK